MKTSFPALARKRGVEHAVEVYRELDDALQTVRAIIAEDGIDCHLDQCGRFIGATSPAHYEQLARDLETTRQHLGFPFHMVARDEQYQEMATDLYVGGAVIPDLGALHPGLYHKGLLDGVLSAGGLVCGHTEVHQIVGKPGSFRLRTSAGEVHASDVIVATNGYTPRVLGWHARRVIPFTGYMAATEPLAPEALVRLLPRRRTVIDSNVNIDFVRPAPDSPRLLFGGATGSGMEDLADIARRLKRIIVSIFPELARVRLSHVWTGRCAATWDLMPHMGCRDGVWYGMGYNFAGVPMGTYFGVRIAQRILGHANAPSVFEQQRFPSFPLYTGNPWFVPYAMRWFDWHDRK